MCSLWGYVENLNNSNSSQLINVTLTKNCVNKAYFRIVFCIDSAQTLALKLLTDLIPVWETLGLSLSPKTSVPVRFFVVSFILVPALRPLVWRCVALQGLMFGYATDETEECMPLTVVLAHKLNQRIAELRRSGEFWWARPDSKTQVRVLL